MNMPGDFDTGGPWFHFEKSALDSQGPDPSSEKKRSPKPAKKAAPPHPRAPSQVIFFLWVIVGTVSEKWEYRGVVFFKKLIWRHNRFNS